MGCGSVAPDPGFFPVDQSPGRVDACAMSGDHHLLDLQFIEARHLLVELAAFLDRCDRHGCTGDYRHRALLDALPLLLEQRTDRAKAVLDAFSDPTDTVASRAAAPACGAPRPDAD
jgi:hypothetical protein